MHAQAAQSAVGELEVLRFEREARQADEARVGCSEDVRFRHGAFDLFIKEV
jgi:hypothetical protein